MDRPEAGEECLRGESPELVAYVKALPCVACVVEEWEDGPGGGNSGIWRNVIDAHHVRTRGAGGGDVANVIPLCRLHHDMLHMKGKSWFESRYSGDIYLESLAEEVTEKWQTAGDFLSLADDPPVWGSR